MKKEEHDSGLKVVVTGAGTTIKNERKKILSALEGKNKPGLIIAAYHGMGQEAYLAIHDDYDQLTKEDYYISVDKDYSKWVSKYVDDAIFAVTTVGLKVCFISTDEDILNELIKRDQEFYIFYPSPITKQQVIERVTKTYFRSPTIVSGNALTDVVAGFDNDINRLREFSNSMMSSTGIINEEVLNNLIEMDTISRNGVLRALKAMKSVPKKEEVKA